MKKVFLFLSIFLLSLSTVLVACNEDRYADLRVSLVSITSDSGREVTYNEEGGYYEVYYGDTITISSRVSSSSNVSSTLNYVSESNESFPRIRYTDTTATFGAMTPSKDSRFRVTVSSIETSRGSLSLYFKVLLPVSQIDISDNLGVMVEKDIDLKDEVKYYSDLVSNSTVEADVDEKEVFFELDYYIDETGTRISLVEENGNYSLANDDSNTPAFRLNNGVLSVIDASLDGQIGLVVKSEKYDEGLEDYLESSSLSEQEKETLREQNNRLMVEREVEIVTPITLDDIEFSGGQVSFEGYNSEAGNKHVKLFALLYNNSADKYSFDNSEFSYFYEDIIVSVMSSEDFDIVAEIGTMVIGDEEYKSQYGVIEISNNGSEHLITSSGNVVGRSQSFKALSEGTGIAYIDFVINYAFDNDISFSFSELYSDYLNSLDSMDYEALNDWEKNTKVEFEVSSIPSSIAVTQDGNQIDEEGLTIFDSYASSTNGSKISVNLDTIGVLDEDKIVRIYITSAAGVNASNFFEIRNANGNLITINKQVEDSQTLYYFDIDLSNEFNREFYIKAKNITENQSFTLSFENLIGSRIYNRNGEEIVPGINGSTLEGKIVSFNAEIAKGVTNIEVMAINGENYYSIDSAHRVENAEVYRQLVLDVDNAGGTLLAYFFDDGLQGEITLTGYDESIIELVSTSSTVDSYFDEALINNQDLQLGDVVAFRGLKVGNTTITFTAENGYSVSVNVSVVNKAENVKVLLRETYEEGVITENSLNTSSPFASAKFGHSFDIIYTTSSSNTSGVISYSYESSNPAVAFINQSGRVTTLSAGVTTINAVVSYYTFERVNGFNQWAQKDYTLSFDLNVFIPASTFNLNASVINVYDVNSLPFDMAGQADVSLTLSIGDSDATIASPEYEDKIIFEVEQSGVRYLNANYVDGNKVVGRTFNATATLRNNETSASVVVTVTIDQFGQIITRNCIININKAKQVESVFVTAMDGEQTVPIEIYDENSNEDLYVMRVRNGDNLTLRTSINPEDALIDDLEVYLNLAQSNGDIGEEDLTCSFAGLSRGEIDNTSNLDINGDDSFSLTVKDEPGEFYITIIARDSYRNETIYDTYIRILVLIENGEEHSYSISNYQELKKIENEPDKNYILVSDILLPTNWEPIKGFTGVLNGNNHTISNLSISYLSGNNIGLFESIGFNEDTQIFGTVYDLKLEVSSINLTDLNSALSGEINIGTLAGINQGIIMNVAVKFNNININISSNDINVGGIVGRNEGVIYNFGMDLSSNILDDDQRNSTYFSNNPTGLYSIYGDGSIPKDLKTNYCIATNYSVGNISVTSNSIANIGGIAGYNKGAVNGYYGIYQNQINSSSSDVVFVTSYQNSGIDAIVNINKGVGQITSSQSSVGGVVGLNDGTGILANIGVEGNIGSYNFETGVLSGTYNNVGGVVGQNTTGRIINVLTSTRVNGNENVGGVVGLAAGTGISETEYSRFSNVRVENYGQSTGNSNNTLVVGRTNVGGIAGSVTYGRFESVYSYGYADKFNSLYSTYGDVYAYGDNAYAGGIAGNNDNQTRINKGFSTFNIISSSASSNVRGLFGAGSINYVEDVFYIGVISNLSLENSSIETILGVLKGVNYYYALRYADSSNLEIEGNKDCFVALAYEDEDASQTEHQNIVFGHWIIESQEYVEVIKGSDLLKDIPVEINVTGNGETAILQDGEYTLFFSNNLDRNKFYNYSYENEQGQNVNVLIINYSQGQNEFDLNDIFVLNTEPESISSINIVVRKVDSLNDIVSITDDGRMILSGVGETELLFSVKENSTVSSTIRVIVVENFDKLLLSPNTNFSTSYLDATINNPMDVRLNVDLNFNSLLVEDINGQEQEIEGYTDYSVEFEVKYSAERTGEYTLDGIEDYITQGNKTIRFNQEGYYQITTSVVFVDENGQKYRIIDDSWVFYLNAYASASDIVIKQTEIYLEGDDTQDIMIALYVNVMTTIPNLVLQLVNQNGETLSLERVVFDETTGQCTYENVNSPFIFTLTPDATSQGGAFYYNVRISVKDEYKSIDEILTYTLKAYDEGEALINDYADMLINLVPASLTSVSSAHYAYTETVSSLVNSTSTPSEGEDVPSYFYSYSTTQSDTIIAGMGGLLVIDLLPYYSNIISVSVKSSLGLQGNALSFVQMVKVKDSTNPNVEYYVYAPTTTRNEDGSVELSLISSMPNAQITVQGNSGVLTGEISYAFEEEENYPNTGRLFVRTIAPSSLSEEDEFDITITVKYLELNQDNELIEVSRDYVQHLEVRSTPGVSLKVSHNGNERDIIAYTGTNSQESTEADWLDIFADVEQNFDYNLTYSVISGGRDVGQSADHAMLTQYSDRYVLRLGPSAQIGDVISIILTVDINYGDYTIEQSYVKQITVVDSVIESLSITGIDDNGDVLMTISSSKQLRAEVNGFGTLETLEDIEERISRSVVSTNGAAYYWYGSIGNSGQYGTLNSLDVTNSLPFAVNQIATSNEPAEEITVNEDYLGVISGSQEMFTVAYDTIYLEGLVGAGDAELLLRCSYVYRDGRLLLIPNNGNIVTEFVKELFFTVRVVEGEDEENLTPIENEEDLRTKMVEGGNYILMNDITIESHRPIDAQFASFDGNNKIITIEAFYYGSSNVDAPINLGLFSTVSSSSIVKNLIVALPDDKTVPMDLTNYSEINFGGIAGINNGIITNCDVITVMSSTTGSYDYTINMNTSSRATVNFGGFVGVNNGIITNSRVGRDSVDVLRTYNNETTIVRKVEYELTSPRTLISVNGAGFIGGFVSTNKGTISSSFAKNLQIEVFNDIEGGNRVRTAGFAVTNNGYINGSYSAGWEEESYASEGDVIDSNRKLGGGLYSNGPVSGFVFDNNNYIQDSYSNINLNGSYVFAARTQRVVEDTEVEHINSVPPPASSGFVYNMSDDAYVYTSYSLSKIYSANNTHGAFESRLDSPFRNDNSTQHGTIENCYFLKELEEDFDSDDERAKELSDSAVIDVEETEINSGLNQFASVDSFNGFAFDPEIEDFATFEGQSSGGVWAISLGSNNSGYPELISANTIAISCRVLNVSKSGDGTTTRLYFTYVADYDLGSYNNPYLIATAEQYNNIFSDYENEDTLNDNVASKFTGNVRLINHINLSGITPASTSVEYTSILGETSVFDGNYLAIYNISLADSNVGRHSFGLFRDVYSAGVKNLTLGVSGITAGNSTSVGALAGVIVDSNIANISLVACGNGSRSVLGNNYVGGLAGIITASNSGKIYYISNIKSDLSIMGGNGGNINSSIKSSFRTWSEIEPINISTSASGGNLRLHNLSTNVYYAGGIAGVIDLRQETEDGSTAVMTEENVTNIHVGEFVENTSINSMSGSANADYSSVVEILSDYAGGLFGFIGEQTYVAKSEFIVDTDSSISGVQVAGGIAGINFGMIAKSYVSYNSETISMVDESLIDYVQGLSGVESPNTNLFSRDESTYRPRYIGGIVGINAGSSTSGSGSIIDSFNRVDVKNSGSVGVGGIAGASYIGEISNVYTTASLMGNLNSTETVYIGGIIGRIFDNANEGYFTDVASGEKTLQLSNIVALNAWDASDFNDLFDYVNNKNGLIGALYGYYENQKAEGNMGIVRLDQGAYVYFQKYLLENYENSYISSVGIDQEFDINDYIEQEEQGNVSYIRLWGAESNENLSSSRFYDEYLASYLSTSQEFTIDPQDYMALFSDIDSVDAMQLRGAYFSSLRWSRVIWRYEASDILPILDYGYESSIVRIYTAEQFIEELSTRSNSDMTYLVMNDIDFSGIDISPITTTFSGRLTGNDIVYEVNGKTYTRSPILFNLKFEAVDREISSYALFETTSNATISNLNFVVSDYNVTFDVNVAGETRASIIVANGENVTLSNVNIYGSLLDRVSKVSTNSSYATSLQNEEYSVSQGVSYNDSNVIDDISDVSFLKLARWSTGSSSNTPDNIYTFVLDKNIDDMFRLESIYNRESGETYTDVPDAVVEVVEGSNIITNASTFGGLVATTNESTLTIENSGTNLDISVVYNKNVTNSYIGSLVGSGRGYIRNTSSQSYIDVQSSTQSGSVDVTNLYVGSVAGYFQGEIANSYLEEAKIIVGGQKLNDRQDAYFVVNRPSANGVGGAYIGGVVGSIGSYVSGNSYNSGRLENVYIYDLTIETFIKGQAFVAGGVARNQATLSDVYIRQSSTENIGGSQNEGRSVGGITVHLNDNTATYNIGGVIAENSTSTITNIYSNIDINIDATAYHTLYVGGIVAQSTATLIAENLVSDAEIIEMTKNATINSDNEEHIELDTLYIGGVIACGTNIELYNVISTVDIISDQERSMYVGGVIGSSAIVSVANVIVLGDITLREGKGVSSSYFYLDGENYYIGGLIGQVYSSFTVTGDRTGEDVLVASTIRDYAIAQKLSLNMGSVIGGDTQSISYNGDLTRVFFNENISLVSNDNTYNLASLTSGTIPVGVNDFTALAQSQMANKFSEIFDLFVYNSNTTVQQLDTVKRYEGVYSTLYSDYYMEDGTFLQGSKLNPKVFTNGISLLNNEYYVMNSDINISVSGQNYGIASTGTNWVLNAQGYSINAKNGNTTIPVFNEIGRGSAVSGLMVVINQDGQNPVGNEFTGIANINNGFLFSCGVSGEIKGAEGGHAVQAVSSLVFENYGVINRCFSTANITGDSGAGLVLYNGRNDVEHIGNIYDSYYTGSITAISQSASSSVFTGMVYRSDYGVISNSYSMADIEVASVNYGSIYPIVDFSSTQSGEGQTTRQNIYRTYYDYVAYLGNNEGVSINDIRALSLENASYITQGGIYVWTTTFSGDMSIDSSVKVTDILQTSWVGLSNMNKLVESFVNISQDDSKNIDNTWFNFGYVTKDMQNIFVNSSTDDISTNTKRYFSMLYSGNGLAGYENTESPTPTQTSGFVDMPYSIKHGGLLDMLVTENCREEIPIYRYYMFTRNINLIKYQDVTYWSENWDKINAKFVGSLDGRGRTVSNMFSTYGLVRAIPNLENSPNEVSRPIEVKNIVFNNCISKTGLVAGYFTSGSTVVNSISNITVDDTGGGNYVYNGDLKDTLTEEKLKKYNITGDSNNMIEKVITDISIRDNDPLVVKFGSNFVYGNTDSQTSFAGGLVGLMAGGLITNITINGLTVMSYDQISKNDSNMLELTNDVSYIGGIVGIMTGGTIAASTNTSTTRNIEAGEIKLTQLIVASSLNYDKKVQTFSYVGGVAGLISGEASTISDVSIGTLNQSQDSNNNPVTIYGMYSVGGVAGLLDGGVISNCDYNISTGSSDKTSGIKIGYAYWDTSTDNKKEVHVRDFTTLPKETIEDYETPTDNLSDMFITEVYLGGISGTMSSGIISQSDFTSGATISLYPNHLSGLYSIIVGGIVGDIYEIGSDTLRIEDCRFCGQITLKTPQEGIVGGIVGRMRGGDIVNCISGRDRNNNLTTSEVKALIGDPIVHSYSDYSIPDTEEMRKEYAEIGDQIANLFNYSQLWHDRTNLRLDELLYSWIGHETDYTNLGINHFYQYVNRFNVATEGYSVAGGLVGRMIYGNLQGDEGQEDGNNLADNNASVFSNYSAGGIVGEILNLKSAGFKTSSISNMRNEGSIYAVGTIVYNIETEFGAEARIIGESSWQQLFDVVKGLSGDAGANFDVKLLLDGAATFSTALAGGIVGYVMANGNPGGSSPVVTISGCSSSGEIGSPLATASGGIAGLVSNSSGKNDKQVLITNCSSTASLKGYIVRSFAGGIVGYLDVGTITDCVYSGTVMTELQKIIDGTGEGEVGNQIMNLIKDTAHFLIGIPNVAGGIVGYVQNGKITDCNTSTLGLVLGMRVAGGIVGVAAGGTYSSNSVMYNNGFVIALYGIAGGIFGTVAGRNVQINSFGDDLSLVRLIEIVLDINKQGSGSSSETDGTQKGAEEDPDDYVGFIEETFGPGSGVMLNGPLGIVVGYVSGGIVGYYDDSYSDRLHGLINLGRVYSSMLLIISSGYVIDGMQNLLDKIQNSFIDFGDNLNIEGISQKLDDIVKTVADALREFDISFGAGLTVDDETLPLIEFGATSNILGCFDFGFDLDDFTFGFDRVISKMDHQEISFRDYLNNIVVNKYEWINEWEVNSDNALPHGLRATENICEIGDDYFDELVDIDDSSDNIENIELNDPRVPAGRGSNGGIVGFISGTSDVEISLTINYGIEFPNMEGLGAFLSPAIGSSGISGGIVGTAIAGATITSSFNFIPVIGRTSGGIVGYAGSDSVRIVSVNPNQTLGGQSLLQLVASLATEETMWGQVANFAKVNGAIYAGGIIGYSNGANVNTKQIESLLSAHEIGGYYEWNGTVHASETWFETPDFADWSIFQVVNSGSVFSDRYSGGIVGFMDSGTSIYLAHTSASPLTSLGNLSALWDFFTGGETELIIVGSISGGIAGYMSSGYISGTCYVGGTTSVEIFGQVNEVLLQNTVRIGAIYYKPEGENSSYNYGGYAGGVVGMMRGGRIGGKGSGADSDVIVQVQVNDSVKFGYSDNHISPYVGGAIGFYDQGQGGTEDYLNYVNINVDCTVSNGKFTGGLFGRLNDGAVIDFTNNRDNSSGSDNPDDETIVSKIIVQGVSENMEVRGVSGTIAGGIVGSLKNGTVKNVISTIKVTGETNATIGGIVGSMIDGTIQDVIVAQINHEDGKILYGGEEALITVDSAADGEKKGTTGGIVGEMNFTEDSKPSSISRVVNLANISGGVYSGGIVGTLTGGKMENTYALGNVEDANYSGGLVGNLGEKAEISSGVVGEFEDFRVYLDKLGLGMLETATFDVTLSGINAVGGLVGYSSGKVLGGFVSNENVTIQTAEKKIEIPDIPDIPGLPGQTEDEDTKELDGYIGGIVGEMAGGQIGEKIDEKTESSSSEAKYPIASDVTGNIVGGLVGYMHGGTIFSGKSGNVTVSEGGMYGGGLIGRMAGDSAKVSGGFISEEEDDYTDITVTAVSAGSEMEGPALGGLVGLYEAGSFENSITGLPVGGGMYGGGIIGHMASGEITSGWDITKSTVEGQYAGGLVGRWTGGRIGIHLPNGMEITGGIAAGGLVGLASGVDDETTSRLDLESYQNISMDNENDLIIKGESAGGFIGATYNVELHIPVSLTANGKIEGSYVGGVIGYNQNSKVGGESSDLLHEVYLSFAQADMKGVTEAAKPTSSFGGVIGYNDSSSVFYITIPENKSIELTINSQSGARFNVGSIVGYDYNGSIYNCINNFDQYSGVSTDAKTLPIANQGGIVGEATLSTIVDCTNNAEIIATNYETNLGGIAGRANSAHMVNVVNEANLSYISAKGGKPTSRKSYWADGSFANDIVIDAKDSNISYEEFNRTYSGSIGGLVGIGYVVDDTTTSDVKTAKLQISGTNNAEVLGYFYYAQDSTENRGNSYYEENADDISHDMNVADRRGTLVGSLEVEDVVKEEYVVVKNTDPSKCAEQQEVGDLTPVTIKWAERNENDSLIKKQNAYVIGFEVIPYTYAATPKLGSDGLPTGEYYWLLDVTRSIKYYYLKITNNPDELGKDTSFDDYLSFMAYVENSINKYTKVDFAEAILTKDNEHKLQTQGTASYTDKFISGITGSGGTVGNFTNPSEIPEPSIGLSYTNYTINIFYRELETTYNFTGHTYTALQDIGFGGSYERKANVKEEYLSAEVQGYALMDKVFNLCKCKDVNSYVESAPSIDSIFFTIGVTSGSQGGGSQSGGETG